MEIIEIYCEDHTNTQIRCMGKRHSLCDSRCYTLCYQWALNGEENVFHCVFVADKNFSEDMVKVKQSHYRPGHALGFQEVEDPRFLDNRHMKVVTLTPLRPGRHYPPPPPPRKYSWYSFLLEVESTSGPYCDRKDYVNEKFQ
jgi:hypothetical protein